MRIALSLLLTFLSIQLFAQCVEGECENGKGTYLFPNGSKYIGMFKDGMIHGKGICHYTDGSYYDGEWAHRYPDGKGKMVLSDGQEVSGTWKQGVLVDEEGKVVEDEFSERVAEDMGMNLQTGCVKGDCKNGEGLIAYANGSRYDGKFKNGKAHGQGTFYYSNGDRYVGNFMNGLPHGEGTKYRNGKPPITGNWSKGELLPDFKKVEYRNCSGGDCQSGLGTFFYKEGKFVGEFKDGQPLQGTIYFHNGDIYKGQLENHNFNGLGIFTNAKYGTVIKGFWENGAYHGKNAPKKEPSPNKKPAKRPTKTGKQKVWAVIIGVSQYAHMPVLRYTDDDAYRMYAFFKSPEGGALDDEQIRILIDEDATKKKILEAMEKVFTQAGEDDLVVLYFSGHGLKGSFLPIDFDGFDNKVLHTEINDILRRSPAKHKLCIADACHSGSLLAMKGSIGSTLETYYKRLAQSEGGTALIMSSKGEETSLESKGLRQGVFSHYLIRGLKGEADADKDKIIEIGELYNYVSKEVIQYTARRQSPVLKGQFDVDMPIGVIRK